MPLDPRLPLFAGQGVTPIDPQAVPRGMASAYELQGLRQQQAVNQLKLEDAQRQEFERQNLGQAIRGTMVTDPVTGQQRPDLPAGLARAYTTSREPLTLFKVEQDYTKGQAESRKTALEAQKLRMEGLQKQTEWVSGLAMGALQAIEQGNDPQQTWDRAVAQVQAAGLPTQNLPPTPDLGLLRQYAMSGLKASDALQAQQKVVDQQLRELELQETQKRTTLEQRRAGLEERRTQVQEEDLGVRREDIAERRAERLQTRETQAQQRVGERENQLRDEFNTLTKDYRTVADAYGRIQSAQETGPGDISLIFSYMKLLDPGSTVREGEFATAQNAGGVPERIIAQYNRLVSGERLAPETRRQFLDQAQGLYEQASRDYQRTKTHYGELAKRYGADPANVTAEFGSTATPRTRPDTPGTGKVLSEQDITDTIAAEKAKGRTVTRQKVIDAAREKGYQVP